MFRALKATPAWLERKPVACFLLTWLAVIFLYAPGWRAGYQYDAFEWFEMFYTLPFAEVINIHSMSLYQLDQFQLYILTSIFGTAPLPWFLLLTALFSAVGNVLFRVNTDVYRAFGVDRARTAGLLGLGIFLVQPSFTEAVLWKAPCYHYHTAILIILALLRLTLGFVQRGGRWRPVLAVLLFTMSTFMIELFYITPFAILALLIGLRQGSAINRAAYRQALQWIATPILFLFVGHLALHRLVTGSWLGRGAFSDMTGQVSWQEWFGRVLGYEFHLLFVGRLFPQPVRDAVYSLTAKPAVGVAVLLFLIALAVWMAARFRRASPAFRVWALLTCWAIFGLGLILHYELYKVLLVINDTYLYPTGLFQCAILGFGLSRLRWGGTMGVLLILGYTVCTIHLVRQWRQQERVFKGVLHNYRWHSNNPVILLNTPVNYRGIGIVRSGNPETFNTHLRIYTGDTATGKIFMAAGYNMEHPWSGAHVVVQDSMHLKVTLNQWGTWWWYGTRGATSYENELYRVDMTDPGHEYILELKQRPPGLAVLLQKADGWREVDFSNVGGEQW